MDGHITHEAVFERKNRSKIEKGSDYTKSNWKLSVKFLTLQVDPCDVQ